MKQLTDADLKSIVQHGGLDGTGCEVDALATGREIVAMAIELINRRDAARDKFGPRFQGSPNCKSGSLASGGRNTYCTCDVCF